MRKQGIRKATSTQRSEGTCPASVPREVQQLPEEGSVLVNRVPRGNARDSDSDIVVVIQVGQSYTRSLHLQRERQRRQSKKYYFPLMTYLVVHQHIFLLYKEQLADLLSVGEPIVLAALATALLTLDDGVDETSHHVELRPMYLAGVVVVIIGISFVRTNEIGEMNLPTVRGQNQMLNRDMALEAHNAGMHAPFVFLSAMRYFWCERTDWSSWSHC